MESALPFHQGQESSIKGVRYLNFVRVLTQEEDTLIDQIADDESQDLS